MTTRTDIQPEIDRLKSLDLGIEDAIVELNKVFLSYYGLDAYTINCGDCEFYADCLSQIVEGCEGIWGDELVTSGDDPEQFAYHHITRYNGRYYDSQHPWGVDDFREISAFWS